MPRRLFGFFHGAVVNVWWTTPFVVYPLEKKKLAASGAETAVRPCMAHRAT